MAQLAKLIREKYPTEYNDMTDEELEHAVLAKYPEYQDLVEEQPPTSELSGTMSQVPETMSLDPETQIPVPESYYTEVPRAQPTIKGRPGLPLADRFLAAATLAATGKVPQAANLFLRETIAPYINEKLVRQLSGEQEGTFNPIMERNPLLFKSFLPPIENIEAPPKVMGAPLPELGQRILGKGAEMAYEGFIRPTISPLGLYSSLPGLNPIEHPSLKSTIGNRAPIPLSERPPIPEPPWSPITDPARMLPDIPPERPRTFIAGPEGTTLAEDVIETFPRPLVIPPLEPGQKPPTILPREIGDIVNEAPDLAARTGLPPAEAPLTPVRFPRVEGFEKDIDYLLSQGYRFRRVNQSGTVELIPPETPVQIRTPVGTFGRERVRTDVNLGQGQALPGEPQLPSAPPKPSRFSTPIQSYEQVERARLDELLKIPREALTPEQARDLQYLGKKYEIIKNPETGQIEPPPTSPKLPNEVNRVAPTWETDSQRIRELLDKVGKLNKNESNELARLILKYSLSNEEIEIIRNAPLTPEARAVANTPAPPLISPMGEPVSNIVSAVRSGSRTKKPVQPVFTGDAPRQAALSRFMDYLLEATKLRDVQNVLYAEERAKRFGKVRSVTTTGIEGAHERLRAMRGELPKVEVPQNRAKFTVKDANTLYDMIWNTPGLTEGQKLHATVGLDKLLTRQGVPQNNELNVLIEIVSQFGPDATKAFAKSLRQTMPYSRFTKRTGVTLSELASFRKAMMAAYDLSAPLRQGLPLMLDYHSWKNPVRESWLQAWGPMFKSARRESSYQLLREVIRNHPDFKLADTAGLELTDILTGKEEMFQSRFAESIPGVRQSNRAYTAFLNKLRIDTFKDLLDKSSTFFKKDMRKDAVFMRELANYLNVSTGRGNLGTWVGAAEKLNNAFFSPKLMASRFQMMGPGSRKYYQLRIDPSDWTPEMNYIRRQKLKAILSVGSFASTMATLGAMAGADIELDPRSSDFMKVKFGDTRIDFMGGFSQYAVLYSRLATGWRKSSLREQWLEYGSRYGYPTKLTASLDFFINKSAPEFGLFLRALMQKGPQGEPINFSQENIDRLTPILANDLWHLMQEDPSLVALIATIPGAFGAGVQTYEKEKVRPF